MLTLHDPSFEFSTFWYLNLAAIVAVNATHQTPVLSIFTRFFNCSWNVATLLVPLVYPDRWYFVGLAILMYTFGMYRHALSAHQFFLQQVRLEETSTRLAEQFKQAKEQAEDALQEKSRFLATASHDLRQPVHAMGMLVHALLQRNQDASLTPALRDLSSSVRTMSTLFNSLLDLSKLESGAQRIDLQEMDLRKSVREVMALFEGQAQQQGLTLHLHLPKRAARVMADANLLRQIFINLLQNALRYTPRGGILVGIRRREGTWRIEVWDTGMGVAEDSQEAIYLPYFRHEHAWAADSAGHGLGLAVVARCANLMNARYGMNSRLGKGSRFGGISRLAHPNRCSAYGVGCF